MPSVTMIQKEQAQVGHEFVYLGPGVQCQDCRIKSACLNQSPRKRYKVVKLRDVVHDCMLNGDVVRVVEVEPSAPPVSLDLKAAREGSMIVYQSGGCLDISCDNYPLCRPGGLESGQRIQVLEIGGRLKCPLGRELVAVKVTYASE